MGQIIPERDTKIISMFYKWASKTQFPVQTNYMVAYKIRLFHCENYSNLPQFDESYIIVQYKLLLLLLF